MSTRSWAKKDRYLSLAYLALALVIFALPFSVLAWMSWWLYSAHTLENHGLIADGTVVQGQVTAGLEQASESCSEDIEFVDSRGNRRHAQRTCEDPAPPGTHVVVHYAPGANGRTFVEGDSRSVNHVFILSFVGLGLAWFGFRLVWPKKQRSAGPLASP